MYYVKVATRGAQALKKGSPRQALDYIADGHDLRRDPGYSDAELAYIARMDDGWKTDLEGGRIPLVGLGELCGVADERVIATAFEEACQAQGPWGKQGYKSLTFTVPKEVSLFAEGHREKAKEAMYAAVQVALDRALDGKEYRAVAAIHTRNESGEIHHHVHVLIGKFARERDTGKIVSLNGRRSGNGPGRVRELKLAWKEAVDKEFKDRLGLTIEQRAPNSAPALVIPDGTRLEPLSRASRRLLEKDLSPWYAVPGKSGALVQRQLRLGAMDDRIFEIAAGDRGASGWNLDAFRKTFRDQERFITRYEKRVETLKAIGYLTDDGHLTPEFRLHFALRHGINTPELQRIRLDLANQDPRHKGRGGPATRGALPADESRASEAMHRRIERLGLTRDDIDRAARDAHAKRPTPETLRVIRLEAARRALSKPLRPVPRTKTVIRAFMDLQKARAQRVYLLVSGAATLRLGESKTIADRLLKAAERDLFNAKEKRIAQLATGLRPIFWAVKIAMPRHGRRLEKAVERCSRLAYAQEIRWIQREEIRRAYLDWRKSFLDRPSRDARALYERGYSALQSLARPEAGILRKWEGREEDLVRAVYATARQRGDSPNLAPDQYQAAVRASQIGRLLMREEAAPTVESIAGISDTGGFQRLAHRLHAFDIGSPFSSERLRAVAPVELDKSLALFRDAGLLGDGPGWALKAGTARSLAQDLGRMIDRAVEADLFLTDALLKRRHSP